MTLSAASFRGHCFVVLSDRLVQVGYFLGFAKGEIRNLLRSGSFRESRLVERRGVWGATCVCVCVCVCVCGRTL